MERVRYLTTYTSFAKIKVMRIGSVLCGICENDKCVIYMFLASTHTHTHTYRMVDVRCLLRVFPPLVLVLHRREVNTPDNCRSHALISSYNP